MISFNETKLSATVTLVDYRGKKKTLKAKDGCRADRFVNLK